MIGRVGAMWGLAGVSALLGAAIIRLSMVSLDALAYPLAWNHWLTLVANVIFMGYAEGYRGFHRAFSPRVAARARHIKHHPRVLHVAIAPLFCMCYFHTTRRRLITAYLVTLTIIGLVVLFHHLSQPWRGVLDIGIVAGLALGLASVWRYAVVALGAGEFPHSPELPAHTSYPD